MMVRNASNKAVIVDVLHLSVVRLAAAVHETLSPFMTEMREDLAAVKTEMKEDLAAVKTAVKEDLAAVKTEMKEDLAAVKTAVKEDLAAVKTEVRQDLAAVKENLTEIKEQVDSVTEIMSNISDTVTNVPLSKTVVNISDSVANVLATVNDLSGDLEEVKNQSKPGAVLQGILPHINSLEQNILTNERKKTADYILEHLQRYECGGTRSWRRVVYLDMTDPNTNCPSGWNLTTYSKRACGKVNTSWLSCDSVFFHISGGDYTSVCGSIRAFQYSHIDAFEAYHFGRATTIEGAYVSGVSLTHGNPRQHIWTFAAGSYETDVDYDACPCDTTVSITIPPFVGGDYFCESGVNSGSSTSGFHPDDPLWDGEGCSSSSSCCSFNNPPYFTKQLPSPTSDPIEARLCRLDSADDSPVEFMELYVK